MAKLMDFEENLKTLDEIAEKMESGGLSLEDSLKNYEQAMKIIKECESYIKDAKLRIEKVTSEDINEAE